MTSATQERTDLRALRRTLDEIRVSDDGNLGLFVQAMERLLTAASYPDPALVRSYLEDAKVALGDLLAGALTTLLTHSSAARRLVTQFTDQFEGKVVEPNEQFDDLGRSMSRLVSNSLRALREFRDGPVPVAQKYDIEVPNAAQLSEHIAHWEQVKADLVDCWPWSGGPVPLPPADREMIARSRAALQAGERGESLEAVIARRRST